MKNIFKENDVLLKEFGAVQLAGDDLVLFEHNKKSCFSCFLYWYAGFGLHRFYMGDKFSKIYGCYFLITMLLRDLMNYQNWDNSLPETWLIILNSILIVTFILDTIELFLLTPLIKWHNIILKQNIIEKNTPIKDRGPYRVQEAFSFIVFFTFLFLRFYLTFTIK